MSFLQAAIQRHSFQLVECLVSAGANVNHHWKRKLYGLVTPLQSAVQRKHDDIVGLLLQRGADVNAPANENGGQTALQIAVSQNNHAMVKLLISHKADVNGMPSPARGRSALKRLQAEVSWSLLSTYWIAGQTLTYQQHDLGALLRCKGLRLREKYAL
jgi:ankyrin repeat protein